MAAKSIVVTNFREQLPGALKPDGTWAFPSIVTGSRSGKRMYWNIYVRAFSISANPVMMGEGGEEEEPTFLPILPTYLDNKPLDEDIGGWYKVDSGFEGGKLRESAATLVLSGKNIGRANATNTVCQALRDALGLYTKQLKKTVAAGSDETACARYPPMLAQVYTAKKKITFPVYIQRKYNGMRTVSHLCDDAVVLYSRNMNTLPGFDYLREDILPILRLAASRGKNVYLDGELYKHGVPLQTISGNGRRSNTVVTDYKYMVYDLFIPEEPKMTAAARRELLVSLMCEIPTAHATLVETFTVNNSTEIEQRYAQFLDEGFEGAMLRLKDAGYELSPKGYHSKVLLKIKPTYDAEFKIVGWEVGEKGKASGALMIVCETESGDRFSVTPAMEIAERVQLAERMPTIEDNGQTYFDNVWNGVYITVQYAELSVDGIPLQPRTRMNTRVDEPTAAAAAAN